jgi:hypothetical protein
VEATRGLAAEGDAAPGLPPTNVVASTAGMCLIIFKREEAFEGTVEDWGHGLAEG